MSEGPQVSVTPWRRDPERIATGLAEWGRRSGRGPGEVTDVRAPDSGMANDTVMFRLDGEPLVARLAPAPEAPYPTFPTFDLGFQKQVMDLVRARTEVPVPEVVHLETDQRWLGSPFLVSRAVEGLVASDNPPYLLDPGGWFLQGGEEDWRRFERSTLEILVAVHRVADDGPDTAFLRLDEPGDTALARLLASHRRYYEWAQEGNSVPILERALERLEATRPDNVRSVLNWGDSRPGNIIYRDFRPAAVLDWEMAGVGPQEADVAWLTFFHKFFASMAEQYGLPPVPAMFDPAATVDRYEELSGLRLEDLAWYEALAGLRFGIILLRMSMRSIAFGLQEKPADPDGLIMFAPLLDRLLTDL